MAREEEMWGWEKCESGRQVIRFKRQVASERRKGLITGETG